MNEQQGPKAPEDKICAYEYTVKRGDSFYLIAHRLGVPLRDLLAANAEINPARLAVGDVLCIPLEEDDRPQETPQEETLPESMPRQHAPESTEPPQAVQPVEEAPAPQTVEPEVSQPEPAPPAPEQTPADVPDMLEMEMEEARMDADAMDRPAGSAVLESPPEEPILDQNTVCPNENRYILRQGETLTDVQLARGLTWHTLTTANPSADLSRATAGQEICVPDVNIPCALPRSVELSAEDTIESIALRYDVSVGALLRANPCMAPADFVAGACVVLPQ